MFESNAGKRCHKDSRSRHFPKIKCMAEIWIKTTEPTKKKEEKARKITKGKVRALVIRSRKEDEAFQCRYAKGGWV
jgi:hypothetical protein